VHPNLGVAGPVGAPVQMSGEPVTTLKLITAYDGTGFWGSQRQIGVRTVQGELEAGLAKLNGSPVRTRLSGRTDRGVHAIGQVVSCVDIRPELDEYLLIRAIEAHLPEDLGVVSVERKAGPFHARFDATWREYRYRIWSGSSQPLVGRQVWQRRAPLDPDAMASAARWLIGTHDLATFTGGGDGVPWSGRDTTRTIMVCSVRRIDPWWGLVPFAGTGVEIRIVANGFLPQLVRNIVGALVAIGSGAQVPTWIAHLLDVADRRHGPATAPPHGLILWRVGYGDELPDSELDGRHESGITDAYQAYG